MKFMATRAINWIKYSITVAPKTCSADPIRYQFPGHLWIHFYNGYIQFYLFFE
jgi:hypothetical protein